MLPEQHLLTLAESHAAELFSEQGLALNTPINSTTSEHRGSASATGAINSNTSGVMTSFGVVQRPWKTQMRLQLEPLTVRAAFSNVVTWDVLMKDMQLVGQVRSWQAISVLLKLPFNVCLILA
jgi:hypothetical protein